MTDDFTAINGQAPTPQDPDGIHGEGETAGSPGVRGANPSPGGVGVQGFGGDAGVQGFSGDTMVGILAGNDKVFHHHTGVYGESDVVGVFGHTTTDTGTGVYGHGGGSRAFGVRGETSNGIGVQGENLDNGTVGFLAGIDPVFLQNTGVFGQSDHAGVFGNSDTDTGTGVYGRSSSANGFGIRGESVNGIAVQGKSFGFGLAGKFEGNVAVTGSINVDGDVFLTNKDICERFGVISSTNCEPGTVMVIGDDGMLTPCSRAYDRRVVGVISGAGTLRPAITLGHGQYTVPTVAIALVGTAYCMVDADESKIEVGDLLTTSASIGYAVKACDPYKSFGAVLGKALAPLTHGRGLIPIVITLQ